METETPVPESTAEPIPGDEPMFEPDQRLERYLRLDRAIDAAEDDAIRTRWDFGKEMLAEREEHGGKQLKRGRMAQLMERTGKSRQELSFRARFAFEYPTIDKVSTAVETFRSWTEIRDTLHGGDEKAEKPDRQKPIRLTPVERFIDHLEGLDEDEMLRSYDSVRRDIVARMARAGVARGEIEGLLNVADEDFIGVEDQLGLDSE